MQVIMDHKEFLAEVQKRSGLDKHTCAALLSAAEKLLVEKAVDLVPVELEGIGVFVSTKHPEFIQENQDTGETVLYPPRITYRLQSHVDLNQDSAL